MPEHVASDEDPFDVAGCGRRIPPDPAARHPGDGDGLIEKAEGHLVPTTWTPDELQDVLAHATPIVRTFLHGLAVNGSATTEEIGVHHAAAAIGNRYAKSRGKELLFTSAKDGTTGKAVYTIASAYRDDVARILAGLPNDASATPLVKRGPGRPRKVETEAATPKRRPGRPRKIDVTMESLVGCQHRRGRRRARSRRAPRMRSPCPTAPSRT